MSLHIEKKSTTTKINKGEEMSCQLSCSISWPEPPQLFFKGSKETPKHSFALYQGLWPPSACISPKGCNIRKLEQESILEVGFN